MLNSVNTNVGALHALRHLNATTSQLHQAQRRISTGERVSSARDNGAVWAIAQERRSEIGAMGAVLGSLQRARSITDVAMTGGDTIASLLNQMKEKALSATYPTRSADERQALDADFKVLRDQIADVVKSAEFNGINLLKAGTSDMEVLAGLAQTQQGGGNGNTGGNGNGNPGGNGNGNGNAGGNGNAAARRIGYSVITVRAETMSLGGPIVTVSAAASVADPASAQATLAAVTTSIANMGRAMARLGTASRSIDVQAAFVTRMRDTLEVSVGQMVDADLAKESARMLALETRQKLGIQALSVANARPGMLLELFR